MGFCTGYFTVSGLTAQIFHDDKDEWDDSVINRECGVFEYDGYVSNVGREVTIHIKRELNSEKSIHFIKEIFSLESELVESVEVVLINDDERMN